MCDNYRVERAQAAAVAEQEAEAAADSQWQGPAEFDLGDEVLTPSGELVQTGGLDWATVQGGTAYDTTVDDLHTFYVQASDVDVLVHNCDAPNSVPGSYVPDRTLPTDRWGVPVPDVDLPHTQLGTSKPKYGSEPQAREWDYGPNGNLQPQRDIDFSDHGSPLIHPNPHQHALTPNNPALAAKGGYQRGPHRPF